MKKIKSHLLKRLLCFLLVGCIVSTSVFFSYSNTLVVKADTTVVTSIERTIVTIAGIIAGVLFPEYGTYILISEALAYGGIEIQELLIDNGDGTYTIPSEAIQAVLSAMQEVENSTFDDDDLVELQNGTYIGKGWMYARGTYTGVYESITSVESSAIYGGYINKTDNRNLTAVNAVTFYKKNGSICRLTLRWLQYIDGVLSKDESYSNSSGVSSFLQSYCSYDYSNYYCNVPVFETKEELLSFIETGEGYENALNYNQTYFEYGSKYTGTYSGGDITVSESILNGISAKVDSLNQTSKSTDEKLEELLEYITEESEDEEPETGGTDDDEEIEGSTWLERIFNVLKKIYGKIKSIRRWVIADTVIDGIDLVTELFDGLGGLIKDLIKTPLEAFAEIMTDIEQIGNALSSKFPFCIPWDIAFLLGLLSAEPKTPEFKLPLQIETYGIDEEIVLSLEDFEIVSKISRTFLTLIFCHGLLNLTFKIVDMKEKENRNT